MPRLARTARLFHDVQTNVTVVPEPNETLEMTESGQVAATGKEMTAGHRTASGEETTGIAPESDERVLLAGIETSLVESG